MQYSDLNAYLPYSLKLATKPRRGGGNMFRHQIETLAILLEYGYTDPVLLKASVIHDLVEDGKKVGFQAFDEIITVDKDGPAVLALVEEVSQHKTDGVKEHKGEFLLRVMLESSEKAKILKLADRISNISALLLSGDPEFIKNYIAETEQYILPSAEAVNPAMTLELKNRIQLILKSIQNVNTN